MSVLMNFSANLDVNIFSVLKVVPLSAISVVIGCLTIIINTLTLIVMVRGKKVSDDARNSLLVNLLVLDVGGGIAIGMLGVLYSGSGTYLNCVIFFNLNQWVYLSVIFNLVFLMADQYMAIEFPLKLSLIMTAKVIRYSLFTIWVLPVIYAAVFSTVMQGLNVCDATYGNERIKPLSIYLLCAVFGLPFTIILPINIRILWIARQHARRVGMLHVQPHNNTDPKDPGRGTNTKQAVMTQKQAFRQMWKSLLSATIMVGSLVVFALPFCTIAFLIIAGHIDPDKETFRALKYLSSSFMCIGFVYVANPLIYALRVPSVKKFCKTYIFKCSCVHKQDIN